MNNPIVLVTGATGFLGGRLVEALMQKGYSARAFARKTSDTSKLRSMGAGIFFGDVRDIDSLKAAMSTVNTVIHAAADTSGEAGAGRETTVMGTQNAIEAAVDTGVSQFIYLSSCSVYGIADCRPGQVIDESGPLERFPEARGHYSSAKFEAEAVVLKAMEERPINVTCLRPGTIWGPGGETFTPMMGFMLGPRIVCIIGSKDFVLPLVYLDNLVDAVIKCIGNQDAYNQVFNVVDTKKVDKKTYVSKVLKPLFPGAFFFRVPYWALSAAVGAQEVLYGFLKRKPFLTRYRLVSSQRPVVYDAGKIGRKLSWNPPVSFNDAVSELLRFEKNK